MAMLAQVLYNKIEHEQYDPELGKKVKIED